MQPRNRFRPGQVEGLEERKVLSGSSVTVATVSALQGPLSRAARTKAPSVAAQVNDSFASFSRDFNATRGIYFASIQARTAPIGQSPGMDNTDPAGDYASFQRYTRQRVNLLAQQLRNTFQQTSLYTNPKKGKGGDPLAVIATRINKPAETISAKQPFDDGTLGKALFQSTPEPNASPTAVALNALAEDNAIEAARISILNGINSLKVQASRKS